MKKILLIIFIIIGGILFIRFFLGGPEDDWLCQDGGWVKHGQPLAPKPITNCEKNR